MSTRPKGSTYPLKFPCGCEAGYKTKGKIVKNPKVLILQGHTDGRRVCNHGRTWVLNSVWLEVLDGKT